MPEVGWIWLVRCFCWHIKYVVHSLLDHARFPADVETLIRKHFHASGFEFVRIEVPPTS